MRSLAPADDLFRDPAGFVHPQQGRPEPNQPTKNLAESSPGLAPWLPIESIPETDPQVRLPAGRRGGVHHENHREAFER